MVPSRGISGLNVEVRVAGTRSVPDRKFMIARVGRVINQLAWMHKMNSGELNRSSRDLSSLVQQLGSPRVLVLGDVILDRYTWGDAERVSQEAPVIMLLADKCEQRLGGAASVCHMLKGLGAHPTLAGVVGDDSDAQCVRDELKNAGIGSESILTDGSRPTTLKHRFMGRAQQRHPHQMLRVDREVRDPVSPAMESRLLTSIRDILDDQDIVLVSDYAKGVCTPPLLEELIRMIKAQGKRVVVDPIRKGDYLRYRGASLITPNRLEASLANGTRIQTATDALPLAQQLCQRLELEAAVITLDREGMALACEDGTSSILPTRSRQVYDITGAGDMVLAVIGMSLAAGCSYEEAVRLANVAGGLEVERVGISIVTRNEILADLGHTNRRDCSMKVMERSNLASVIQERKSQGERIVFTNGCFDLMHAGHVQYLQEAATHGDCLIVALNSDSSVRRLKGSARPVVDQDNRALMLGALEVVDFVTVFDEDTPHNLLELLKPDVLIKGGTYSHDEVVGWEIVEANGGQIVLGCEVEGLSTTELINRILQQPEEKQQDSSSTDEDPSIAA